MSPAERRLSLWLKAWSPIFAVGGAAFYLLPGAVTASLNSQGRGLGLPEADLEAENLWVVLAASYMAMVTVISQRAASDPLGRSDLVDLLVIGKGASSLGALGYFVARRRSYAFLANFVLDGAICLGTRHLLKRARAV
ncbi:MAG: hypothetical protein ACYDGR_00120 [Candidatus Dormibacteria bacterium]